MLRDLYSVWIHVALVAKSQVMHLGLKAGAFVVVVVVLLLVAPTAADSVGQLMFDDDTNVHFLHFHVLNYVPAHLHSHPLISELLPAMR